MLAIQPTASVPYVAPKAQYPQEKALAKKLSALVAATSTPTPPPSSLPTAVPLPPAPLPAVMPAHASVAGPPGPPDKPTEHLHDSSPPPAEVDPLLLRLWKAHGAPVDETSETMLLVQEQYWTLKSPADPFCRVHLTRLMKEIREQQRPIPSPSHQCNCCVS